MTAHRRHPTDAMEEADRASNRARKAAVALLALALACAPPPPMDVPAPVHLTVPVAPTIAVQRAAQRLVMEGFTIATSDATGGVLTATLTREGKGSWGPFIACNFADDTGGHLLGNATLTVHLTAQATNAGSTIYLTTSANNAVDAGALSRRSSTDCASSGEIERRLAAALSAP